MQKLTIFILINLLLIGLFGCKSDKDNNQPSTTSHTTATELYEIQSSTDLSLDEKSTIEYPQLVGHDKDYSAVNSLIHYEVDTWVKDMIDPDAIINLKYSVVFSDDKYICVLFEGDVVSPNAAHPTNVVFSVCVSLIDVVAIDPLKFVEINDDFTKQLKKQLNISQNTDRFTDKQWEEVVAYIEGLSDEELQQMIKNGETALVEDGILICLEVPHAIGDYIKVFVECERN